MRQFYIIQNFILFTMFILAAVAMKAHAYENVEAEAFIRNISNNVLEVVGNSKSSDDVKEKELVGIFDNVVDSDWIAKFVLGNYWRTATDEQKKKYTELYRKYLHLSYIPNFKSYTNQKFELKNIVKGDTDEYLVQTEIVDYEKNRNIRVDYMIRQSGKGQYKIFDIIAEGVSLITTQRSEFASILARQGIDTLIAKLEAKVG